MLIASCNQSPQVKFGAYFPCLQVLTLFNSQSNQLILRPKPAENYMRNVMVFKVY